MSLDQLYDLMPTLEQDDPRRAILASASPLLLSMHMDPKIQAHPHMRYLDAHVLALCNLQLYPDGPGPEPEVWGRAEENQGSWTKLGIGFSVAISKEAFDMAEMRLVRPGSVRDSDVEAVASVDSVTMKLAIALPPRHGKSMLVTEHLPLWFLLRHPDNSVVVSTYNQDFADEWGKNLQDKMDQKGHILPSASDGDPLVPLNATLRQMSFRPGKDTGVINFRGAGKSLTGMGWGLGIIDDPFKDQTEAMSPTERHNKKGWYTSTFSNRRTRRLGSPPPVEVMMFTRWHEDDLAGAFAYEEDGETSKPGWCVLRLPALAEPNDPLGREVGASLCPALSPKSFLLEEQEKDPTWFSCLFQGRPTHSEGSMFSKTYVKKDLTKSYHHWRHTEGGVRYMDHELRYNDLMCFITVDTATSKKTSADWTVASMWGWHRDKKMLVLIDRKRERVGTESHRSWLRSFYDAQTQEVSFIGIEDKTFGTALINELRVNEPDLIIIPVPADKDKITRATPYSEAVKGGKVLFPDPLTCSWSVEWENEHTRFPNGRHDDQVDTGAMAWTLSQRYAYTPHEEETTPEPTRHDKAKAQVRRRRRNGRNHDYHDLAKYL